MFDKKVFALRLLELRKLQKLSQAQIADVLGVTFHQISKMEKADRGPSVEVLCALADYFDVSLDYLVGRSDDPKRY